jgi:hypothetical protein
MSTTPPPDDIPARIFAALGSVHRFDEIEVRPVVQTLIKVDERAMCFKLIYYRVVSNVTSILALNNRKHFQAHAILSRTLFELDIDIKLIDVIPNAVEKIIAFVDVDRLHCARKVEKYKASHPNSKKDDKIEKEFIVKHSARIDADQARLWPKRRPEHWSGKTIRDRAVLLGDAYEEKYEVEFPRMNWQAHSGLTGVAYFKAETFPKMAAMAIVSSTNSYKSILESVIKEFHIQKYDKQIMRKMKAAELMPFTDSEAEAQDLMP